jgi:hypothetical protein
MGYTRENSTGTKLRTILEQSSDILKQTFEEGVPILLLRTVLEQNSDITSKY